MTRAAEANAVRAELKALIDSMADDEILTMQGQAKSEVRGDFLSLFGVKKPDPPALRFVPPKPKRPRQPA